LSGAKAITQGLFDNYIDFRYTGEEHFVVKFLTYIDDNTLGKVLSESSVSEKLGYNPKYTRDFKAYDKGKYGKYFRFVLSVFLIDPLDFNFKDPSKFNIFKEEIQDLTYKQLVSNKMISNLEVKRMQFDAIISALYALTLLRYKDAASIKKYYTRYNPLSLYTLRQLSIRISSEGYDSLITDQIRTGRPSVGLGKIYSELNKGTNQGIKECEIAKISLEEYLKKEKLDSQDFGNIFHDLYESFTIEYLASQGVRATYEPKVNYPESNHKVDNIIERSEAFIENIENHQNIIEIPKQVNLISVDYTFTSNEDWIREKFYKHYQSSDRFLIIVLLGVKNPFDVQAIKDMLTSLQNSDKSNNLDNIAILTSDEYNIFLGVNKAIHDGTLSEHMDDYKFTLKYTNLEYLASNVHRSKEAYDEVLKNWDLTLGYLSTISTDWISKYLLQG